MTEKNYRNLIKTKCNQMAYDYLINKRGTKGKEIEYPVIQMANYLRPNCQLSVSEQKKIFEIRNKMTQIPANFSSKNEYYCICGQKENMEHVYICENFNNEESYIEYEKIYEGNVKNMKSIVKRFEEAMKKRELHVIQTCDPPGFVVYKPGNG